MNGRLVDRLKHEADLSGPHPGSIKERVVKCDLRDEASTDVTAEVKVSRFDLSLQI